MGSITQIWYGAAVFLAIGILLCCGLGVYIQSNSAPRTKGSNMQ